MVDKNIPSLRWLLKKIEQLDGDMMREVWKKYSVQVAPQVKQDYGVK